MASLSAAERPLADNSRRLSTQEPFGISVCRRFDQSSAPPRCGWGI